jgi:hypothetical protein
MPKVDEGKAGAQAIHRHLAVLSNCDRIGRPQYLHLSKLKIGRFAQMLTRMFPGKRTIATLYRDFLVRCGVWPALGDRKVHFEKKAGLNIEFPFNISNLDSTLRKHGDGMVRKNAQGFPSIPPANQS